MTAYGTAVASLLGVAWLFAAMWRHSHRKANVVDRIAPYTLKGTLVEFPSPAERRRAA